MEVYENPYGVSCAVSRGRTDRQKTYMHDEANNRFSQLLCESAKKLRFAHIMRSM